MDSNTNFESYLFISPKKLVISVVKKKGFENIYKKEEAIDIYGDQSIYNLIDKILSKRSILLLFQKPFFLSKFL